MVTEKNSDVLYEQAAGFYEALYRKNLDDDDKGIAAECDAIEKMFKSVAGEVRRVVDAGCGTGVHSVELAKRGYDVRAFDYAKGILEVAKAQPRPENAKLSFEWGDMREFVATPPVDAVICMTNAFLCNYTPEFVDAALACFAKSIRPGGCLVVEATSYGNMLKRGDFADTYADSAAVGGREVMEVSRNEFDFKAGVLRERNSYFISDGAGKYSRHDSNNQLLLFDIDSFKAALARNGFAFAGALDAETGREAGPECVEYLAAAKRN